MCFATLIISVVVLLYNDQEWPAKLQGRIFGCLFKFVIQYLGKHIRTRKSEVDHGALLVLAPLDRVEVDALLYELP